MSKSKRASKPSANGSSSPATSSATQNDDIQALRALLGEHHAATTILSMFESLQSECVRQGLRIKELLFLAYGRKSEKLDATELEQLALAFGASEEEARQAEPNVPHPAPLEAEDAGDSHAPVDAERSKDKDGKNRRTRRKATTVAAGVERNVQVVCTPQEERACACCHREMQVIGHVDHERIDFVPAKFVVQFERR